MDKKSVNGSIRGLRMASALALTLVATITGAAGVPRIWTGTGADELASTSENWSDNILPATGDDVVFGILHQGNPRTNVSWDLNIVPASWIQTEDYKGTVTIQTKYPDATGDNGFTNLVVTGDVVLQGGLWTHPPNAGGLDGHQHTDRLSVVVGGDFTLGIGAGINLFARGFAVNSGPGAGRSSHRSGGYAASHGGHGGFTETHYVYPAPTYGRATQPETLGSGASGMGGGALFLRVSGSATLDGFIRADGRQPSPDRNTSRYQGGAGGSIYLRATGISGAGILSANGGPGYDTGGGGRIALVATGEPEFPRHGFGTIRTTARPGTPATRTMGAAGTIYFETAAGSQLVVDQRRGELNRAPQSGVFTALPSDLYDPELHPVAGGELQDTTLILTNGAVAGLTSSLRMADLGWICEDSTLLLRDHLLYFKASAPDAPEEFPAQYGGGTIETGDDGLGEIFWNDAPARVLLTLIAGPNGSVAANPRASDNLYPVDSLVLIRADPNSGYDFVFWTGDLPDDADRRANPLTVAMEHSREIRALFASADPNTYTWIGDGTDNWASNPTNWYPHAIPGKGAHIVLDATSDHSVHWNLETEVSSWKQTDGYAPFYDSVRNIYYGWVFFHTRYPGHGSFSNLTINGDVTIDGGVWSHPSNSGGAEAVNRLSVSVGGNFTLGVDGEIDVYGRGFSTASGKRGPGGGTASQRSWSSAIGASHGGMGGYGTRVAPAPSYGSAIRPVTLGSSGTQRGGGSVHMTVGKSALINGVIDAGGDARSSNNYIGGSGGSILLQAASFGGNGLIAARGNYGTRSGGGGRIALIATQTDEFGQLDLSARSRNTGSNTHLDTVCGSRAQGTAGTIYFESPAARRLLVDAEDIMPMDTIYTDLPSQLESDDPNDLHDVQLELRSHARVRIMRDNLRIRDLKWIDADARLHLNGHTLHVRSPYHPLTDGDESVVIIKDGGKIVWNNPGTIITIP